MGSEDDAGRLLSQLAMLRRPSDLDLLIFFARHPRALLASEHLAAFLGYGAKEIAASLELLLDAGYLTRSSHAKHTARMYVLAAATPGDDWLPGLRKLGSTRDGRLALLSALRRRGDATDAGTQGRTRKTNQAPAAPLPFPQGRALTDEASRRARDEPNTPSSDGRGRREAGEAR